MWTAVLFTLLVAGATAERGWKPNTEYRYEVHSKTLASLHQISDYYTGVVLKAQLKVHPKTENHLTLQLSEPKYAEVETTLQDGLETRLPEEKLHYMPLALSNQPVEVKLNKGVIEELVISKDVPVWEVNVIKSIVSQLQVDTQGVKALPSKLNSIPKEDETTGVYKVMEDTVEGDCEVLYDISPLPKYILQAMPHLAPQPQLAGQGNIIDVMKSKNFSNCEQRPGYHFGLTGLTDWEPTANQMGNFLSRSSVSRVIISGSLKSYTIQSAVTTNKVILSPELSNNQKGEVVSRVNLTLTSVHSASGESQQPANPQTLKKLVYDYNSPWKSDSEAREQWDRKARSQRMSKYENKVRRGRSVDFVKGEKYDLTGSEEAEEWHQTKPTMTEAPENPFLPYFVGFEGHSIQSSKNVDVNSVVKRLAEEIGEQLKEQTQVPKQNTLARFSILTRVVRTMNVEQLAKATEELYTPESQSETVSDPRRNAWKAYRDALAQAGTGPALMTIVNLITSQKIKGEEAAQVVGTLSETARFPTTEYMNTFFDLVKLPEVESQRNLNTSALFSFTNLVRMAQVNRRTIHNRYPIYAFGHLAEKHEVPVVEKYIPYLAQKLEQAVKEGHSTKIQTYIRALGNVAHPKILEVFEPYLNGKQPLTDFQRTLMVVSLNKLSLVYPKLARSILYKTYANTGEVYQVRVAAVYNLMKTNPPASMLQRMAQFTHEDPSNQVGSAVKSAILSAADLTEECNAELRKNAEAAVHLLTPQSFGVQYSQHNLTDYIVKGLNMGFSNIGSEDSLVPQVLFLHLTRDQNGFKDELSSFGSMVSSVKTLKNLFDEKVKFGRFLETVRGPQGPTEKGLTLETITNLLNLESGSTKQLEGNLLIGLTGFKRFLTFDNQTIEQLPKYLNELSEQLKNGKTVDYQKLYNEYSITIGLPTASGLPLVYTLNTPTLLSAKGKLSAEMQPQHEKRDDVYVLPDTVKTNVEMVLEYSTRTQSKVSFLTPFNQKRYVAGYDKNMQMEMPLKKHMDLDLKRRHVKVELSPLKENQANKLFHYSTWPYLAIDDIAEFKPLPESPKVHRVRTQQTKKYKHELGDQEVGVVLRLEGESDKDYLDLRKFYQKFLKHGLASALMSSIASERLEETSLDIYYDGEKSSAKKVIMVGSYEYSPVEQTASETQRTGENDAATSTKDFDSQTRKQEFLQKAKQGIKSGSAVVVDLGLKVEGQRQSEYLTTFAFASSKVDERTRLLSYSRKNVNNKNYEVCFDTLTKLPKVSAIDYANVLAADLKGDLEAKIHFGEQCSSGGKVNIRGEFKRSDERKGYLETDPVVQQAKHETQSGFKLQPAQVEATKEAGLFDDYSFTIQSENIPKDLLERTQRTYNVLRYFGYPFLSENIMGHTSLQEGQVELGVNFTPDLKAVNFHLYSPLGDSKFNNIYLNKYLRRLALHPMYSTIERLADVAFDDKFEASCTVDRTNFRTFDNKTYSVNLDKIWHVMLFSDLKGDYKQPQTPLDKQDTNDYVIALVKNTESKQKVVKVVLKGLEYTVLDIIPRPEGEQLKGAVSVNGKEMPISTQHVYEYKRDDQTVLLQIYGLPTGEVKILSPVYKLGLLYYGDNARLTVNQGYMNNVKGLCGTNNGDKFDFITPQEYVLSNPEEFAATWALSSEGRTGEMKNHAQQHSMVKKSVTLSQVVSEQDLSRVASHRTRYHMSDMHKTSSEESHEDTAADVWKQLKKNSSNGCVTSRINVIERNGKHCFSVKPQPTCTAQCRPEMTETQNDEYLCVEKSSTSQHWQQMVARGANPDLRNKGKTQQLQVERPTKCVQN